MNKSRSKEQVNRTIQRRNKKIKLSPQQIADKIRSERKERELKKQEELKKPLLKRRNYSKYLKSKEWGEKRKWILERDENCCQECRSEEKLVVHHLTYENIFKELDTDLITLCDKCHNKIHSKKHKTKWKNMHSTNNRKN